MSDIVRNQIGSFPRWLWEDECRIIDAIITQALLKNFKIAVEDEEERVVNRTNDRATIQRACAQTDETFFIFFDEDRRRVGHIQFTHGNRADVLSDMSFHPQMDELCKAIAPLVEMLGNNT